MGREKMPPERKPELAPVTEAKRSTQIFDVEGGGRQRSDEELVIAAQSGESSALDELLSRHRSMLYCFASRIAATADEADEAVQETMLRAVKNIGKFRGQSRFSTWLVAIVVNAAISIRRKEKGLRWVYLDEPDAADARSCNRSLRDVRPNPEDRYSRRELRSLLRREIEKLHPKYRFILQACDLNECSIEQAAQTMGITLGAAKSRLHRARCSLRTASRRYEAAFSFMRGDMASDSLY
jgi:RNA polymerase sigma-70 factor (ECF subfamily)